MGLFLANLYHFKVTVRHHCIASGTTVTQLSPPCLHAAVERVCVCGGAVLRSDWTLKRAARERRSLIRAGPLLCFSYHTHLYSEADRHTPAQIAATSLLASESLLATQVCVCLGLCGSCAFSQACMPSVCRLVHVCIYTHQCSR